MPLISRSVISFSIILTLTIAALSCTKTTTTPMAGEQNEAGKIAVFYSPPTDREYEELGLITTQTGQTIFHDRSAEGMIAKLKEEALKLGADAIIVRSANEGTWGTQGGGTTGFDRGNAQAVAIKFKSSP